jgi:endonuclease YncB( thermonuclease family)
MARRGPTKPWQLVVLLIVAAIVWTLEQRNPPATGSTGKTEKVERTRTTGEERKPPAAGKIERPRTAAYEVISGCRWHDDSHNDGDSFHVLLPDGGVEQFRLYYVDAPESQFRTYGGGATNNKRIHEQAQDLGLTDSQAVEIGQRAKSRTHDLLGSKPFTIYTRWEDPFRDRRYHAFVAPDGGGPFLEETLVREGLVRIHTKGADLPDGTPVKERLRQLRELENEAKRAKRGAWGK